MGRDHVARTDARRRRGTLIAIRAPFLLVVACLTGVVLAACGGSKKAETRPAGGTTVTVTTTATGGAIDTLAGAGTTSVTATTPADSTALLERVAVARHEGYDRVVFQFENHVPGYRIGYAQPPFTEDGSGANVSVDGSAFVVIRMEPASGFDLETPEGRLVYKGPKRIEGSAAGTSVVREVVRNGDFEAVLSWVVGLSDKVDFRVRTLDGPPRLVIDFRNH